MRLKYRIIERSFLVGSKVYISQFKVLFFWMSIGIRRNHFRTTEATYNETIDKAKDRIKQFKKLELWRVHLFHTFTTIVHREEG